MTSHTMHSIHAYGIKAIGPYDDGDDEKGFYFHSFSNCLYSFLAILYTMACSIHGTNFPTCVILHIFLLYRYPCCFCCCCSCWWWYSCCSYCFCWYCDCCLFWFVFIYIERKSSIFIRSCCKMCRKNYVHNMNVIEK